MANELFTDWQTSDVITAAKLNQMKNEAFSLDNQVPTLGIADDAVTSAKLAAGAVDAAAIGTGAVGTGELATNAVTTIKIGDLQVTNAKVDSLDAAKLTGTIASGLFTDNSIPASKINDGSGSGLNADLLDGKQASVFALLSGATFSGSVNTPKIRLDGTTDDAVIHHVYDSVNDTIYYEAADGNNYGEHKFFSEKRDVDDKRLMLHIAADVGSGEVRIWNPKDQNGNVVYHEGNYPTITVSSSGPTGGSDDDVWFRV